MPTNKRRINITVNDETWDRIMEHRNRMKMISITTAAIDLIIKGLRSEGIIVESGYDALREKVDEDIRRATDLKKSK